MAGKRRVDILLQNQVKSYANAGLEEQFLFLVRSAWESYARARSLKNIPVEISALRLISDLLDAPNAGKHYFTRIQAENPKRAKDKILNLVRRSMNLNEPVPVPELPPPSQTA